MSFIPGWFPSIRLMSNRRQYIGRVSSDTDATSYTFNTTAIGNPSPTRMVLIAVGTVQGNNTGTITGVTVNGVAATSVVNVTSGSAFAANGALFRAAVSGGSTADIVVTTSATTFACVVDVYAIYDLDSMTPTATASTSSSSSGTLLSSTINIPANGIAVMAGVSYNSTSNTLVGLTEDVDAVVPTTVTQACGSNQRMAAETSRAISATIANANDRRTLVAAAWK